MSISLRDLQQRRRGLSGWIYPDGWPVWVDDGSGGDIVTGGSGGGSPVPTPTPVPVSSGSNSSTPPWWLPAILGAEGAVSKIFAPWQATAFSQQPTYYPPGQSYNTGLVRTTGVGFGIDSNGIRLSDGSHIGWFPIIGVIGLFFLIQTPGFTRRRNPLQRNTMKRVGSGKSPGVIANSKRKTKGRAKR